MVVFILLLLLLFKMVVDESIQVKLLSSIVSWWYSFFTVNLFVFSFAVVNRAVAQYAVDSLKDQGVCRVCQDCVNCEVISPTVKRYSSAPVLLAAIGRGGMVLMSLIFLAAFKLY